MELVLQENFDVFLKLIVAMLLGMAIGIERSMAHKTAGMRTFGLVSLGSALFVIISEFVSQKYLGLSSVDPLRMASQVIVGIGFLGAGLIIFKGPEVVGLTTAAGLWVASGIGIAVGFGLYSVAAFVTILTLFAFVILWFIEDRIRKSS